MKRPLLLTALLFFIFSQFSQAAGSYIEYSITSEKNPSPGNMKMYYQDGNSRSEIKMAMPAAAGGVEMSFVMISLKEAPLKSYLLNTKSKTYTESEIKESKTEEAEAIQYEITVVGKEKVNGYNCIHSIVKRKNTTSQQEMWTTTEIKDFEKYKSINNQYTNKGMYKALRDKGAEGFPVRMKTMERSTNMIIDLIKAESRENPASLFSLDGYTKSTAPAGGMMSPEQMKEMREKIQNMTPEERQKYMDEMKKQSQPH